MRAKYPPIYPIVISVRSDTSNKSGISNSIGMFITLFSKFTLIFEPLSMNCFKFFNAPSLSSYSQFPTDFKDEKLFINNVLKEQINWKELGLMFLTPWLRTLPNKHSKGS